MGFHVLTRRIGRVEWRDELIAKQKASLLAAQAEVRALRAKQEKSATQRGRVNRPSFFFKHHEARRVGELLPVHASRDTIWQVNPKHAAYDFAGSHGIRTPRIFGHFPDAASIEWDALPDRFVLKTCDGWSATGVVPLVQDGGTYRDLLGENGTVTRDDVAEMLRRRAATGEVSAELFAEELLTSPYPDRPGLALDIKIYCFYGTVGMMMVRNANGSRGHDQLRVRYFDPDGTDLGDAMLHLETDSTLPEPLFREQLVEAAARLSAALPTPFVRLDFYEQTDGIVFGEITPSPGGKQLARPDIDIKLGKLWEDAEARLRAEIIASGALEPRHGETNRAPLPV
ncbi:MAG: ATP-grasp fold amidoligase family protein [Haloechinothrix sp.]